MGKHEQEERERLAYKRMSWPHNCNKSMLGLLQVSIRTRLINRLGCLKFVGYKNYSCDFLS